MSNIDLDSLRCLVQLRRACKYNHHEVVAHKTTSVLADLDVGPEFCLRGCCFGVPVLLRQSRTPSEGRRWSTPSIHLPRSEEEEDCLRKVFEVTGVSIYMASAWDD